MEIRKTSYTQNKIIGVLTIPIGIFMVLMGLSTLPFGLIFLLPAGIFLFAPAEKKGNCPYCGSKTVIRGDNKKCHKCKNPIMVRDGYFYASEDFKK